MKFLKIAFLMLIVCTNKPATFKIAGLLDGTFGSGGTVLEKITGTGEYAIDAQVDSKGRILVAAQIQYADTFTKMTILRFLSDGTLDTTFGTGGYSVLHLLSPDYATCLVVQPDDSILVGGQNDNGPIIMHFLENGTLDPSFGASGGYTLVTALATGVVSGMAVDSQGRIVLAGYYQTGGLCFLVVRFTSSGHLDTTFGTGFLNGSNSLHGYSLFNFLGSTNDAGDAVVLDASDNIILAGVLNNYVGVMKILASNGHLDTSFGGGTGMYQNTSFGSGYATANSVALDNQGRIVMGGLNNQVGQAFFLLRLTSAGVIDTTFGTHSGYSLYGFAGFTSNNGCVKVLIDALQRIVMAGYVVDGSGDNLFLISRINVDGSFDTSYGTNGFTTNKIQSDTMNSVYGGTLDHQGRAIIVGHSNVADALALARYTIDYTFNYYKDQFAKQALGLL